MHSFEAVCQNANAYSSRTQSQLHPCAAGSCVRVAFEERVIMCMCLDSIIVSIGTLLAYRVGANDLLRKRVLRKKVRGRGCSSSASILSQ